MDLAVAATAFATIFVVELPDKTFVATLVLATRYRPFLVWVGVGLAFLLQVVIAVTAGQLATLLPETPTRAAAVGIFVLGAVLLYRSAPSAEAEEAEVEREYEQRVAAGPGSTGTGVRVVVTSFLVLFAAEWGDLSQLLTVSLVARFADPVSVFVGSWGALLGVSGLAVLLGRVLLRHVRLSLLHYVGAAVCLLLAGVTLWELWA
jgi:putative Ca2+/H+ antiporter (TMEM165/GDT1 family)